MTNPISKSVIAEIEFEFQDNSNTVFGNNLYFSFIFGGFSKGYGDSNHDVDMFVCLKQRNLEQERIFKEYYFCLHDRYDLPPDYIDPVEFATLEELQRAFRLLNVTKLQRIIRSFEEYEAIVWDDIFSGKVSAQTGDLDLLASLQITCAEYPSRWRCEIMDLVNQETLKKEGRLLPEETLDKLNTTRLFRRCVTYLKRPTPAEAFRSREDRLHVCILGGGGNVAEAIAANLTALT